MLHNFFITRSSSNHHASLLLGNLKDKKGTNCNLMVNLSPRLIFYQFQNHFYAPEIKAGNYETTVSVVRSGGKFNDIFANHFTRFVPLLLKNV